MPEDKADPVDVVRRGYDSLSLRYRADDASPGGYGPWIAGLLSALGSPSRVLDLGCGCGIPVARDLVAAGHRVTGVDISDVQIQRARRLVPGARFLRVDATTLRMPPGSFEAVVALYSLIHMPLTAQPALLGSVASWLVEDGVLLLSAGWREWTGSDDGWLGSETTMWWSHADVATYRRWLMQAGFVVLREEYVPEGNGGHSLFWARRPVGTLARTTPGGRPMEMDPAPHSHPAAGLPVVRDARANEHHQIAELVMTAYEEYRPFVSQEFVSEFRQDVGEVFAGSHTEVIVAESNGRLVGTITFYPDGTRYGDGLPPGWTSMRILAIAVDWRRRGVGRALMTECLDRARNLGATRMLLHTLPFMPNAIALHESLGFRRAPEFDMPYTPEVTVAAYILDL